MKVLHFTVVLFAFLALFSLRVAAQKDNKLILSSLPEDATLEETLDYLVKAITQNSGFRVKSNQSQKTVAIGGQSSKEAPGVTEMKIVELKFKGCQISYVLETLNRFGTSTSKTNQSQGGIFASQDKGMWDDSKVAFDLEDIDLDQIELKPVEADMPTTAIIMRTLNYKRTIKVRSQDTGDLSLSVANIVVADHISEQVKDALTHAVTLCQAGK